jgi:anthranilate phosphoribosyltransferase
MNEIALLKLLDIALTAAAVGLEREAILAKVTELQAKGATPEELVEAIRQMRDEAIAKAQGEINRTLQ